MKSLTFLREMSNRFLNSNFQLTETKQLAIITFIIGHVLFVWGIHDALTTDINPENNLKLGIMMWLLGLIGSVLLWSSSENMQK